MGTFSDEMISLARQIARELNMGLNDKDIEAFYQRHEDKIIDAVIKNRYGYYIGYNLEKDRQDGVFEGD